MSTRDRYEPCGVCASPYGSFKCWKHLLKQFRQIPWGNFCSVGHLVFVGNRAKMMIRCQTFEMSGDVVHIEGQRGLSIAWKIFETSSRMVCIHNFSLRVLGSPLWQRDQKTRISVLFLRQASRMNAVIEIDFSWWMFRKTLSIII